MLKTVLLIDCRSHQGLPVSTQAGSFQAALEGGWAVSECTSRCFMRVVRL